MGTMGHEKRLTRALIWMTAICFIISVNVPAATLAAQSARALQSAPTESDLYQEYRQRFDAIESKQDIIQQGFEGIADHTFPVKLKHYGEVIFYPAMDTQYQRLAVFLLGTDGTVIYKTDQLEANQQHKGQLRQSNEGIAAVSFQDVNGDGLTDILLISFCETEALYGAGKTYKVGDVLYQSSSPQQVLYRDYRISGKINQYGMNKSIKFITSYLVREYSTEFLYTSTTLKELLRSGFRISKEQSYWTDFEKWGRLRVVPGTYRMAEYSVFMIYLVNEQGYIVWSFQPMKEYENLYALWGVSSKDIDGDGLKDMLVLARYSFEGPDNESIIESDYSVYYQRNNGFYEDTEIKSHCLCSDSGLIEELTEELRTYWGWN